MNFTRRYYSWIKVLFIAAIGVLTCGTFLSLFAASPRPPNSNVSTNDVSVLSPFTNAIPQSVFHPLGEQDRDPFCRPGYVKPETRIGPVTPKIEPEKYLVVTGINELGDPPTATLQNGQLIEPGSKYKLSVSDKNIAVNYTVLRIENEEVVISLEGESKEYHLKFRVKSIDEYLEKEEPNEKTNP